MSLQAATVKNTRDIIASTLRKPGNAPVRAQIANTETEEVDDSGTAGEDHEVAKIVRWVKKHYKRNFDAENTDRVLSAIEYLTVNYPGQLLPVTLLYWMCNPGQRTISPGNKEALSFAARVSRCKMKMIAKYGRSFFMKGGGKGRVGYIRGYVSREEHATHEAPRAGRNLVNAFNKAESIKGVIGNVETLKTSATFTPEQKEAARDYNKLVANISLAIKGYLPPAPPRK